MCKFLNLPGGCPHGTRCIFSHPVPAPLPIASMTKPSAEPIKTTELVGKVAPAPPTAAPAAQATTTKPATPKPATPKQKKKTKTPATPTFVVAAPLPPLATSEPAVVAAPALPAVEEPAVVAAEPAVAVAGAAAASVEEAPAAPIEAPVAIEAPAAEAAAVAPAAVPTATAGGAAPSRGGFLGLVTSALGSFFEAAEAVTEKANNYLDHPTVTAVGSLACGFANGAMDVTVAVMASPVTIPSAVIKASIRGAGWAGRKGLRATKRSFNATITAKRWVGRKAKAAVKWAGRAVRTVLRWVRAVVSSPFKVGRWCVTKFWGACTRTDGAAPVAVAAAPDDCIYI